MRSNYKTPLPSHLYEPFSSPDSSLGFNPTNLSAIQKTFWISDPLSGKYTTIFFGTMVLYPPLTAQTRSRGKGLCKGAHKCFSHNKYGPPRAPFRFSSPGDSLFRTIKTVESGPFGYCHVFSLCQTHPVQVANCPQFSLKP